MLLKNFKETKMYIEPVSKNIMDASMEFCAEHNVSLGFTTARGHGGYRGGYVYNLNTIEFKEFIDHYGDLFFYKKDQEITTDWKKAVTGFDPLFFDVNILDIIHIDPWRDIDTIDEGIELAIDIIQYCHFTNKRCYYEIGTSQTNRYISHNELDYILQTLQEHLTPEEFDKIIYVVIQSQSMFKFNYSGHTYDSERLKNMLAVCKKYSKMSKDVDSDYLDTAQINKKFEAGLDAINIGRVLGTIESRTIISRLKQENPLAINELFHICLNSADVKMDSQKDYSEMDKENILLKYGHYSFTHPRFKEFYNGLPGITDQIKNNIKEYLRDKLNILIPQSNRKYA